EVGGLENQLVFAALQKAGGDAIPVVQVLAPLEAKPPLSIEDSTAYPQLAIGSNLHRRRLWHVHRHVRWHLDVPAETRCERLARDLQTVANRNVAAAMPSDQSIFPCRQPQRSRRIDRLERFIASQRVDSPLHRVGEGEVDIERGRKREVEPVLTSRAELGSVPSVELDAMRIVPAQQCRRHRHPEDGVASAFDAERKLSPEVIARRQLMNARAGARDRFKGPALGVIQPALNGYPFTAGSQPIGSGRLDRQSLLDQLSRPG